MSITRTKLEVQTLSAALAEVGKLPQLSADEETPESRQNLRKFRYACGKNPRKLKDEMAGIVAEMQDFNEAREALCNEHSTKDAEGEPVVIRGRYQMKNEAAFGKALDELEKAQGIPELMKEEVELDLHLIAEDCIPISLPQSLYTPLLLMVDDN